jgi:predicted ATPase
MATLGQLQRIKLEGFLSIRRMDLELKPLNLLIGPNGAGKSNLIKFFRFMGKLLHKDLQIHVQQDFGGADALLHFGRKVTERIEIDLYFAPNSYHCTLVPVAGSGGLVFSREYGRFYGPQIGYGGANKTIPLAKPGSEESGLPWNEPAHDRKERHLVNHMEGWKRYHFDDTSDGARVKQTRPLHPATALEADAGNLAAFLRHLWLQHEAEYRRIVETVQRVSPAFQDFLLEPEGGIRLRWKHRGVDTPFDVSQLSDGTLRFICLATLLLQPDPPRTIVLDEPELGLHPYAIQLLAGMMRSAASRTQVVAATQSVTLANQFGPEDLVVAEVRDNATEFRRLAAGDLGQWLDEYRMGDLWEKNLIGGTPD